MKRIEKSMYLTDSGKKMLALEDDRAEIFIFSATAGELIELANACMAAARELEEKAEKVSA